MKELRFPEGFFWGAATSAHQIEGQNIGSDWWRSEVEGRLPQRSGAACDSWRRWREDVRMLADLGLNAYRYSVEWARIEPEPGRFDEGVLDQYRQQAETLREVGVEPIITLHHFTNPAWLADQGAWASDDTIERFATYADRVGGALDESVRWWITVNEPSMLSLRGYLEGAWPPHRQGDIRRFLRAQRHIARGHAVARQALRAHRSDALSSIAFAIWPLDPLRAWNLVDRVMANLLDWLWQGRILQRTLPALDWIGVNYYTRVRVGWPVRLSAASAGASVKDRTDVGWEIYPGGLYRVLKRVGRLNKAVIITENGIADADDDQRPRYIVEHLRYAHRAIREGVDLRGYMHWSLLDNYELAEGFAPRFGLYAVDFSTGGRSPRPSAQLYASIARSNRLVSEYPS